jgi:hypothetical protein
LFVDAGETARICGTGVCIQFWSMASTCDVVFVGGGRKSVGWMNPGGGQFVGMFA